MTVKDSNVSLAEETVRKIITIEKMVKEAKAREEELKAEILAEMEARGIIKIDNPELLITYVPAGERETFDAKAFREECPDLYDEFVKISPVKASIRIKVR